MPFSIEVVNNEFADYVEENHFGHRFTVRLTFGDQEVDECNLRWYERTNHPYVLPEQWQPGEWMDLVAEIGGGSDVFAPWVNREGNEATIDLTDPPGINFAGEDEVNSRTLEFYIVFSNPEGDAVWLRLRQELNHNGAEITRQFMEIVEEGGGDNPMYPPDDPFNPDQG